MTKLLSETEMPPSAEVGAWLIHALDPNWLLTEPPWVSLLHIPKTKGTMRCQAPKLACLQPYSLSWAEQHNPAVCHSSAVTYQRCQAKYSCWGRGEVGSGRRCAAGRRRRRGGGSRSHCTALHSTAAWVRAVPQKQSRSYSTGWLSCCWTSGAPSAGAHQLPCFRGLCICAPLCASQSAPVPFPRLNTVSYPSTLNFINPRWNMLKQGIKLVWLNFFSLKNLRNGNQFYLQTVKLLKDYSKLLRNKTLDLWMMNLFGSLITQL